MYVVGTPVKVNAKTTILYGIVVDVDFEDGILLYEIQLTKPADGLKVGFRFEATEDQVKGI